MIKFTVEKDGETLDLAVVEPTVAQQEESEKVYNKVFAEALSGGALLRAKLNKYLAEQQIWGPKEQEKYNTIEQDIIRKLTELKHGKIKLSEARTIALDVRELRTKLVEMTFEKSQIDSNTAEGQADNAKFNYLVSQCVVYNKTRKPYFNSYEEFKNTLDVVALVGARKLSSLLYTGMDYETDEEKFLKKWKLVDDKGRLVNKDGKLINEENKLINEFGQLVDEDGNLIDNEGNKIDLSNQDDEQSEPEFLDDEGNVINVEEYFGEEKEEPAPEPKKRGRPKKVEAE